MLRAIIRFVIRTTQRSSAGKIRSIDGRRRLCGARAIGDCTGTSALEVTLRNHTPEWRQHLSSSWRPATQLPQPSPSHAHHPAIINFCWCHGDDDDNDERRSGDWRDGGMEGRLINRTAASDAPSRGRGGRRRMDCTRRCNQYRQSAARRHGAV